MFSQQNPHKQRVRIRKLGDNIEGEGDGAASKNRDSLEKPQYSYMEREILGAYKNPCHFHNCGKLRNDGRQQAYANAPAIIAITVKRFRTGWIVQTYNRRR